MPRVENNSLVRDGSHVRVFVADLEPGDVTAFGETVVRTQRLRDERVLVYLSTGQVTTYRNPGAVILIRSES
jgi:hypothetical protein